MEQKKKKDYGLTGMDKEVYEYYFKKPEINFRGFSDTVVFYIDLLSHKEFLPIQAVHLSLLACSAAVSSLLATEHVARGGIDIGCGGVIYEDEIYGPVLNCAHYLENELAKYPRVLIGDGLIKYLQTMHNTKESDFRISISEKEAETANYILFGSRLRKNNKESLNKYVALIKKEAELCFNFLTKDFDQHPILDYFGDYVSNLLPKDKLHNVIFDKARKFAKEERERFEKLGDNELHQRYINLCNYLESRKSFWK